jgi:hypothetical protein
MPSEPDNRKMEELLKAYGKKRQKDLGAPLELHPATRKMLQAEAAKLQPAAPEKSSSFLMILARIWPRVAIGAGAAVLLSLAIVNVNRQPNGPEKSVSYANKESEKPVPGKPVSEFDHDAPRTVTGPAAPAQQPKSLDSVVRERDESVRLRDGSGSGLGLQGESEVLLQQSKDAKSRSMNRSDGAAPAPRPTDSYSKLRGDDLAKANEEAKKAAPPVERQLSEFGEATPSKKAESSSKPAALAPERQAGLETARRSVELKAEVQRFDDTKVQASKPALAGAAPASPAQNASLGNQPSPIRGAVTPPPPTTAPAQGLSDLSLAYDAPKEKKSLADNASDFLGFQSSNQVALVVPPPPPAPMPVLRERLNEPAELAAAGTRAYVTRYQQTPQNGQFRFKTVLARDKEPSKTASLGIDGLEGISNAPVLATFDFQQTGEVLQLIDADGSVYEGRVTIPASENFSVLENDKNQKTDTAASRAKYGYTVAPSNNPIRFTASGTNRTLGKPVLIRGSLLSEDKQQPAVTFYRGFNGVASGGGAANAPVAAGASGALGGTAGPAPAVAPSAPSRIQCTVTIDKTNELSVDARRVIVK